MYKPFPLFIGLRYTLTRKRNFILSFVSLISMLGVSLGVMVLIIALSVMNGSITTLRNEALKSVPHVILAGDKVASDWPALIEPLQRHPGVMAAAPFTEGEASIRYQGRDYFIRVRGVDATLEQQVISNPGNRYHELLNELAGTDNGIVLGAQSAGSMRIFAGDDVVATAVRSLLARRLEESQGFRVIGFADFGLYANDAIALVNLDAAMAMLQEEPAAAVKLRLRVDDVFRAEQTALEAIAQAGMDSAEIDVQPWNETQANLFNALNMEKLLTSFMLLMIVVVGAVNIISTLVMVVADKSADIAILRTMGASRHTILQIFVIQGLVAGVGGVVIGALLGVFFAANITEISFMLERLISALSDSNVYLISHLQTQIYWSEVGLICVLAVLISFLATLYPAYRASRIQPAEVLRYE